MSAVVWTNAPALTAGDATSADAAARYQRERALCTSGQSNQDRTTCLREASAAHARMRKNGMMDHDMTFEKNAQKRYALPNDDRSACLTRMQACGSTSGSVSGGGIYRELVTTEAAAPIVAKPAADSSLAVPK